MSGVRFSPSVRVLRRSCIVRARAESVSGGRGLAVLEYVRKKISYDDLCARLAGYASYRGYVGD